MHEMMGVTMVMVKTNKNPVRTIPMGPLGDIRTTNMMVNGKIMAEKSSVFPTFHNYGYYLKPFLTSSQIYKEGYVKHFSSNGCLFLQQIIPLPVQI